MCRAALGVEPLAIPVFCSISSAVIGDQLYAALRIEVVVGAGALAAVDGQRLERGMTRSCVRTSTGA
jgi:hypothetical protein